MPLSWNEIKSRAITFIKDWEHGEREEADAKEFLIDFLNIFGISRKKVATFEHKVKKLGDADGYIDLLWKGELLVEMKSRGKDLEKGYKQAKDYCAGLKEVELPKQIIISDFERFDVYDINGEKTSFVLKDLLSNIQLFGSIAGYEKRVYKEQDVVNIDAAERMGKLHDQLKDAGYTGHELEVYLVRLVFCMFADDTHIFDKNAFLEFIENRTSEDGSDLAPRLAQLFQVLNTPEEKRNKNLDENLAAFPYVNGKLFETVLSMPDFTGEMRKTLIHCCGLHWGKISPAIFGSLFQSVMDEKARRNLGAHYTSEKNIMKVIKPLFLDELEAQFEKVKNNKRELQKLHEHISKLKFLDPACGCGNFLIISYRELRLQELRIVQQLLKGQQVTSINDYFLVDVDQFYGIEYEDFPSQIAQVAMWLIDHQMNEEASLAFGEYYKRIPLKKSATIVHGNALRIDRQSLIEKESTISIHAEIANVFQVADPVVEYKTVNVYAKTVNANPPIASPDFKAKYNYIFGNPPFIGQHLMSVGQKHDMNEIFYSINGAGVLDYVAAWYIRAAQYLNVYNKVDSNNTNSTRVAFVSTNSVVQGEQVGILWNSLYNQYKIKIHFAHQTFNWSNEARLNAAVHVVIIGFSNFDIDNKRLFQYQHIKGEPHELSVKNINAYLIEGRDFFLPSITKPINNIPEIKRGNSPYDGGYYLFDDNEKNSFLAKEPGAAKYIKHFLGAKEFINNIPKWCLWLKEADPTDLRKLPSVLDRIQKVKEFRENSPGKETQSYAKTPALFRDRNNPDSFIVIPRVSSENRKYIPNGFFDGSYIAGDTCMAIMDAELFHFGVLTSEMHMVWIKYVCGRLKSDFRYSKDIVYNNFPWPENPTDKQKQAVEKAAQGVLDARAQFPEASLADLYDPNTMPPVLVKAHQALDKAVDLCYRSQPFPNETKRIEFLFELYDKYTAGLFVKEKKGKKTTKGNKING